MITYRLSCSQGHEFEGWFKDSSAYDTQRAAGALSCPMCGDGEIQKAIMSPAVKGSVTKAKGRPDVVSPAPKQPDSQQVHQFVSGFRKFVQDNAEYVGRRFPEEARKIHYGETGDRHIYGESTLKEAWELLEEGIDVAPVPPDPDDLN